VGLAGDRGEEVGRRDAALLGETVERRLKTLAFELGLRPEIVAG